MLLMQHVFTVSLFNTGRFGQNETIMEFMNHDFPFAETRSKGNFLHNIYDLQSSILTEDFPFSLHLLITKSQQLSYDQLNYCMRLGSVHLTSSQLSFQNRNERGNKFLRNASRFNQGHFIETKQDHLSQFQIANISCMISEALLVMDEKSRGRFQR